MNTEDIDDPWNRDGEEAGLVSPNGALWNYPWVRQQSSGRMNWERPPHRRGIVARMTKRRRRGDHLVEERIFVVHDNDYTDVYGIEGDCPVEAVLPLSIWPNVKAVSAWPVHQLMSKVIARGAVIEMLTAKAADRSWLNDPEWFRRRYYSAPDGIDPGVDEEVRALLDVLDDAYPVALELWIQSYLQAKPTERWRWSAQGVRTKANLAS
jgi:hypothetical protein